MADMPNVWTQFQKLLPSKLLQSGIVTSIDANTGTCIVELPDGKSIRVMLAGITVDVNDPVFVRGGEVVGPAPSLTVYEVTV